MAPRSRVFSHPIAAPLCLCLGIGAGLVLGLRAGPGTAAAPAPAPTEHKGLSLEKNGRLSEDTIRATTGLEGYFMQLRTITIAPGGQIAKHDHARRPGLVKVLDGAWVEGRPEGERIYTAEAADGILEDEGTTHWFFNRGDAPATAIVCDLTPVE